MQMLNLKKAFFSSPCARRTVMRNETIWLWLYLCIRMYFMHYFLRCRACWVFSSYRNSIRGCGSSGAYCVWLASTSCPVTTWRPRVNDMRLVGLLLLGSCSCQKQISLRNICCWPKRGIGVYIVMDFGTSLPARRHQSPTIDRDSPLWCMY